MTITPDQLHALSGYLQRIGFTGTILDPNDHDESIHQLANLLPSGPDDPYVRIYSYKPASNPNVLNGGHLFTYGVTGESMDAIITTGPSTQLDKDRLKEGLKTLKPFGLVILAYTVGNYRFTRSVMTINRISHLESFPDDDVVVGEYLGGA